MTNKKNNCPICDKAGISDYKKENVICPQCNTDLSIYRTISKNNIIQKATRIILGISVLSIVGLLLFRGKPPQNCEREIILQDSIKVLNIEINSLSSQMDSLNREKTVEYFYVIGKGDSFYKISKKIFNTEKYASEIASLNDLSLKSVICPGMRLKIPQK